jgi:hypothetical protein
MLLKQGAQRVLFNETWSEDARPDAVRASASAA